MSPRPPPVIWDVVEEHLDEAAFLAGQWERALASPRYTVAEVAAGPEERLLAHLAGLEVAGDEGVERILLPALDDPDPGKVFAAAAVLARSGRLGLLRAAVPEAEGGAAAVARALALALRPEDGPALAAWVADGPGSARAAAVRALGARGERHGAALGPLLEDPAAPVRAAALALAAGEGEPWRGQIEAALRDPEPEVRDAALLAALRLGLRAALAAARRIADEAAPAPDLALAALGLGGDPEDLARLAAALARPAQRRPALRALGLSGWPRAGDLCLPFLADPGAAPLAFEALGHLAGPAVSALAGAAPEDDGRGPPPPPGPEAELPFPDADLAGSAWQRLRARLPDHPRVLLGAPWGPDAALRAFLSGSTRARRALALDLEVRSRGGYRIDPAGWAREQLRAQGAARLVARADLAQPWSRTLRA
jgi:uncharacterized protein (TIGR02270 family)